MPNEPGKVTVRMYNVGFGDCFLVTFHYAPPLKDQHILIDFGSVSASVNMKQIALGTVSYTHLLPCAQGVAQQFLNFLPLPQGQ